MAETKRVIYYDQLSGNQPTNGDVIFVDNPTTGTHKMDLKSFVDAINNGFDSSIKSSGVSVSADNYSSIITNVNDQPVNSIYTYGAGLQSKVSNLPSNKAMTIINFAQKSTGGLGQVMLAVERNGSDDYLYFRTIGGSPAVWSSWVKVANNSDVEAVREALDNLDIETDKTLSIADKPADAKAAGDAINDLKADLDESVSDLKSALNENYKRTNVGQYTPLLEVGSINFTNNTITYGTYKYRVRTKEGTYQALKEGDVVKLSTYTDARFLVFWKVGSTWYSSGWRSNDYTVTVNSDSYIFMLAKVTEDTSVVYTDSSQIGFTLLIEDNHSAKAQIVDVSTRMSEIESVFNKSDIVQSDFLLVSGRLHCYYGQMLSGGVARITTIPANTRVGFQGYNDPEYKTKTYDSGWITSTPCTYALDAELYYKVVIANYDYSAITDASIANNFVMYHDYNIDGQIDENMVTVEKRLNNREMYQSNTVKSIAHRGDYVTAPQCTKPAYILAKKNGFRYAENDVNITRDNKYVMWHDTTLSRLGTYLVDISGFDIYMDGSLFYYYDSDANKLYTYTTDYVESQVDIQTLTRCEAADYGIPDLDLAVLKRIDFGIYKGAEYKGTTILTFGEWVMLCKMLGMELYIDSKIGYTQERVNDLVDIVRLSGMLDKATWVNITNATVATYVRNADPNARLGILENPTYALVETFAPFNTGRGFFFNGNAKVITANDVKIGLNAGFEVEAYYVDYVNQTDAKTIERITEFVSYGVTGLTLDAFRVEDIIDSL